MKKNIRKIAIVLVVSGMVSCTYEFPENPIPEPTTGQADFSKMVVIGDGIAAGFMDGALYTRGQQNSFAVPTPGSSVEHLSEFTSWMTGSERNHPVFCRGHTPAIPADGSST